MKALRTMAAVAAFCALAAVLHAQSAESVQAKIARAKTAASGLATAPKNSGTWIMWAGTPYAHLMVNQKP